MLAHRDLAVRVDGHGVAARTRDGVLVIGPSNAFLRYIDQVLPSLGEESVTLRAYLGHVANREAIAMGLDQDDTVIVPYTTGMKRFAGVTMLRSINVQAATAEQMTEVQNGISELLRQRLADLGLEHLIAECNAIAEASVPPVDELEATHG